MAEGGEKPKGEGQKGKEESTNMGKSKIPGLDPKIKRGTLEKLIEHLESESPEEEEETSEE